MAKVPGLVVERDDISQTIDLKKWTGQDLSQDPTLVREIGQAVVDYMAKRVAKGQGIDGQDFNPNKYSESYRGSLDFKAAGKKPSPVNMKLSGDMLSSVDFDEQGSTIRIAVGGDQLDKAHGHMTGQEGKGPLPKREWFGISESEFKKNILPKFTKEIDKATAASPARRFRELVNGSAKDGQGDLISQIRTVADLFNLGEL